MSAYVINPNYVTGYSTYGRASIGTYFDRSRVLQTAGSNVQRINWNPLSGAFEGVLVEPARTNYLLQTNVAAYRLTLAQTVRFGAGFLAAGVPYTLSFYGTGTVTLSGVAATTVVGTGTWVRTTLTITPGSGTLTFTPSGDVFFAQFEQGSYPTSWIPTTSATVTRAADVLGPPGMFQTSFTEPRADYNAGTTYSTGQEVRVETRIYRSLVDGNVGNNPPATSVKGDPAAKWLDIGPANPFACLDQSVGRASVGAGPLQTFALKLGGPANVVGLVGVEGTTVHVAINDLAGNIYSGIRTEINDSTVLVVNGGTVVSVAVENTAGDVRVGECVVGVLEYLGETEYGHEFSILDFSVKSVDEQGESTFVEGPFAKLGTGTIWVKKADYNRVAKLGIMLRAKPTVWVFTLDSAYSAGAILYGNSADFKLLIPYPTENLLSLQVQGLT